jgi:hypothetical protein
MSVRDIFLAWGQAYLDTFASRIPARHRKVIRAIINCRTPSLGAIVCGCTRCANKIMLYRSCGDRHCPVCQGEKAARWFEQRIERLLPVEHFMITCTVPAAFREFFRANQRLAYSALFTATSSTLSSLARASTSVPADTPGFFGVLHTWGRNLQYHPHIHYIVPAGAFDSVDHRWHSCPHPFYLPVRLMSKQIKSRFFRLMRAAGLLHLLPPDAWKKDWNVNSQPAGNGERSIRYLSSYVFRTAISDHRIIGVGDNNHVMFRYTDTRTGKAKTMTLPPFEFIRRFLQHVLPAGFMKIRYYGFMHPSTSIPVKLAVVLLQAMSSNRRPAKPHSPRPILPVCRDCEAPMQFLRFIPPEKIAFASGFP